ncbi:MAG TPA: NYN domain-containing protein [Acidimicrobiia bacterium]|jgi:predicted RNA-binding protein with PIN domain
MARIVVDGMNVIGSRPDGWWRDRDAAAWRLVRRLQHAATQSRDALTLVLDGRPPPDLAEGEHDGVDVRYALRRGRDAADDRIVELVAADANPASLRVVTSDRNLVDRVTALGATTEGAGAFLRWLDRLGA